MRTSLRFLVWLGSTLVLTLGVDALGYLLPAGDLKFDLLFALQVGGNLVTAWLFGLIRFRNTGGIGLSVLVVVLALLMPAIFVVLAIVSTLLCGIDACGY